MADRDVEQSTPPEKEASSQNVPSSSSELKHTISMPTLSDTTPKPKISISHSQGSSLHKYSTDSPSHESTDHTESMTASRLEQFLKLGSDKQHNLKKYAEQIKIANKLETVLESSHEDTTRSIAEQPSPMASSYVAGSDASQGSDPKSLVQLTFTESPEPTTVVSPPTAFINPLSTSRKSLERTKSTRKKMLRAVGNNSETQLLQLKAAALAAAANSKRKNTSEYEDLAIVGVPIEREGAFHLGTHRGLGSRAGIGKAERVLGISSSRPRRAGLEKGLSVNENMSAAYHTAAKAERLLGRQYFGGPADDIGKHGRKGKPIEHDLLTTPLSMVRELHVVSRSSAQEDDGTEAPSSNSTEIEDMIQQVEDHVRREAVRLSITKQTEANTGGKPRRRWFGRKRAATASTPPMDSTAGMPRVGSPRNVRHRVHLTPNMTWDAMSFSEIFDIKELVGEGACGRVYKAVLRDGDPEGLSPFAVKVVDLSAGFTDQAKRAEMMREVEILKLVRHPCLVSFFGSCWQQDDFYILMEFCELGTITDLRALLPFTEDEVAAVLSAVVEGLAYLHANKIIHRDLKGSNILLTREGDVKIADFSVSAQLSAMTGEILRTPCVGTPLFMAPEVVAGDAYDNRADIWSLGILAIELADGVPPWASEHPMRAMFIISSSLDVPTVKNPADWSPLFLQFLEACLQRNADKRLSAEDLLKHPFIAKHREQRAAIVASLLRRLQAHVAVKKAQKAISRAATTTTIASTSKTTTTTAVNAPRRLAESATAQSPPTHRDHKPRETPVSGPQTTTDHNSVLAIPPPQPLIEHDEIPDSSGFWTSQGELDVEEDDQENELEGEPLNHETYVPEPGTLQKEGSSGLFEDVRAYNDNFDSGEDEEEEEEHEEGGAVPHGDTSDEEEKDIDHYLDMSVRQLIRHIQKWKRKYIALKASMQSKGRPQES